MRIRVIPVTYGPWLGVVVNLSPNCPNCAADHLLIAPEDELEDYAEEQARDAARALPDAVRDDEVIETWADFRSDMELVGERPGPGTGELGDLLLGAGYAEARDEGADVLTVRLSTREPPLALENAQHVFEYVCEAGPNTAAWTRIELD